MILNDDKKNREKYRSRLLPECVLRAVFPILLRSIFIRDSTSDYDSTSTLRLRCTIDGFQLGRMMGRVKIKRARKEYLYLPLNWGTERPAADSDEFRRRILIPFDLSARLFSTAAKPGSLIVTSDISIPDAARGRPARWVFPQESREERKRMETFFAYDASGRINGCLARRRDVPTSAANISRMNNGSTIWSTVSNHFSFIHTHECARGNNSGILWTRGHVERA